MPVVNHKKLIRKADYLLRRPGVSQSLLLATAMLLVLVVVMLIWWLPAYKAFYQVELSLQQDQQALDRLQKSQLLTTVYQQTSKDINLLKASIDAASGQAQITRAQQALARRHNIDIKGDTFSASLKSRPDGYTGLRQQLSLQGSYRSLRSFIFALQQLPGAAIIDELQMESVRLTPGVVTARLNLTLYYKAPLVTPG